MATNAFGKFIRKYRIDSSLLLKDMADALGIKSAYLSGMETGSKPIPAGFCEKIANTYGFDNQQKSALQKSIDESQTAVKVKTFNDPLNQQLAAAFARSINDLSIEDKQRIMEIFKNGKKRCL